MRTFRKCITEFMLDPVNQPFDFRTHMWRYPVRIDIAIEYLGISQQEYTTLFKDVMPRACAGERDDPTSLVPGVTEAGLAKNTSISRAMRLSEFLKATCLTYCEFIELWKSKFVEFANRGDERGFPDCEPCCLDTVWLQFPESDVAAGLSKLVIFIRLWHKLKHLCGAGY